MKIDDIPFDLRPREKALRYGIEQLSDQELLALIIGSGVRGCSALEIANNLLARYCNSLYSLSYSNYESLLKQNGLKNAVAMRLLATFEFNHRLNSPRYQKLAVITTLEDLYFSYKYLENYDQEVLIILMLDSKKRIKQERMLYKGTFDGFSIDVRQVVQELILAKAKSFILIHNHPDEETKPSDEDILATKVIKESAKNLGVHLLDHLIIFKGGYYSFFKWNNS